MSDQEHKPRRQRSPNYPGIDLETALARAEALYAAEGRNAAPNEALMDHWGYSPKSGPGFSTLGALKRFGLLVSEGTGKSRLSDLALRIILDEREDSSEREEAIKQAALLPGIHQEIWAKFPNGLPSDATLRHFLRFEKGFSDSAADELIREFRSTISFAQLAPGDSLSRRDEDSTDSNASEPDMTATLTPARSAGRASTSAAPVDQQAVPIPLSATEWVTLQGAFPLSETAWGQLMRVLEVMKPGLVSPPSAADEDAAN